MSEKKIQDEIEALIAQKNAISKKIEKQQKEIAKAHPIESFKGLAIELKRDACIKHLHDARVSHKKWMSNVQSLLRIGDVKKADTTIPKNSTECQFGLWYYQDGEALAVFPEYREMEKNHDNIHDIYFQIYSLYNSEIKSSLFSSEKSQKEKRYKKALSLSHKMTQCSGIMSNLLIYLEDKLRAMPSAELEKLLK